jgi:aspartyl-tRNA synthetase
MSFVEEPDVLQIMEEYFKEMTKQFPNKKIKNQEFPIIKWKEAMDKYGSDKPDLRYE